MFEAGKLLLYCAEGNCISTEGVGKNDPEDNAEVNEGGELPQFLSRRVN